MAAGCLRKRAARGVITADNNCTVTSHQIHKRGKRAGEIIKRFVMIEMVGFDISNNCNVRVKIHKRAIRFICFAHKVIGFTTSTISFVFFNNAAN